MLKVNAFEASQAAALDAQERRLVERRQRLLGPAYQLFYERPLHFVRGEGCYPVPVGCTVPGGYVAPLWFAEPPAGRRHTPDDLRWAGVR